MFKNSTVDKYLNTYARRDESGMNDIEIPIEMFESEIDIINLASE